MGEFFASVIGFVIGAGGVGAVGALGARHIQKHPEILMKFLAHKAAQEIKKARQPVE
jgi:hypothetical protein